MADSPASDAGPVDWLSGACLLARKSAFDEVRGFSPAFFMYFEEVDLARRLAARGWQTWYESAARVVHHLSRSADQDPLTKDRHFYGSKCRFVARYWGSAVARALCLAWATLFTAELAVQCARRDTAQARRFRALVRWHAQWSLTGALSAPHTSHEREESFLWGPESVAGGPQAPLSRGAPTGAPTGGSTDA